VPNETYAKVVEERSTRPERFPPRNLRDCQDRLLRVEQLLNRWREVGKEDGVHGRELRYVLYAQEAEPRDSA